MLGRGKELHSPFRAPGNKANLPCDISCFCFSDVIIGFSQPTYDVAEGAGMVTVTVAVLNGTLDQDIEVTVSTMDGSATGRGCMIFVVSIFLTMQTVN